MTNTDRADVDCLKLESERIMENQTREKGNLDFEEQLREIDAEISGITDTGCNVEKAFTAKILENKIQQSTHHKGNRVGEVSMQELGPRLPGSGSKDVMGQIDADEGLIVPKAPLAPAKEMQFFQIGPKLSGAIERGCNKRVKSLNRKKPHAHATKLGKENVGMCTSKLPSVNAMDRSGLT